jgi:mannose-6-phosphate isomerase-like protein (cupin superfamily)
MRTSIVNSVVPVNLNQKFSAFSEHWRPKVVAELNGQEVKLVKCKGEFVWHQHDEQDEMFLVWKGNFRVEFRDRAVELSAGEFLVVPRGIEHRTAAEEEVEVVIFEPAETRNTGNIADDKFTAPDGVAI